ncbi:uncharacterized protein BHQ10_005353 [Talaromyces amestolkiae]|uniref:C2H2-type domain-containing protein n=1 Tax=Talaromyces amestolkiae TaxID=1196081 RepID=A0A364L0S8_TALAM|nr:uncharacterized protein BHQ10_005353 [Talaromyces amestolkiae]RAO69341.1 hypothetical protein BHQ10_005353 [Talaromyces amestolkiae]
MAWFLDQPSWGQGVIYGSPLADASGSVSPFFPDIEPNLATDYEAYLNPSINDAHHLGYGHQYHTTPASIPSQWAAIASPSIPNLTNRVTNNLHSAVNQPPIVPASRHPEPKPRTRKKDLSLVIDSYTHPRPAPTFECKWEGCNYPGTFKREHELIRHLRTIHITPLAHHCPVEGCDKVCNRDDNLLQHMRNRHGLR